MNSEFHVDELTRADQRARVAADKSVKPNVDYEILKDSEKDVLAAIMSKLESQYDKISETKLERIARVDNEWRIFKAGKSAALLAAKQSKIHADNCQREWETIRSLLSYRKEEMQRIHGT